MPKRLNYGATAVPDSTPIPPTSLSATRAAIINNLWKQLNNNTDPAVTAGSARAIISQFEEQRCPQVSQGVCSAEEMERRCIDALCEGQQGNNNNDNGADDGNQQQQQQQHQDVNLDSCKITKERFFQFHADFLDECVEPDETEREIKLLLRWVWKLNQPDAKFRTVPKADLAVENRELFKSSAFLGQRFQEQPLVDDSVNFAQGTETMSRLVPFAMPKLGQLPRELEGHFYANASMVHHRTHCIRNGEETLNNRPEFTGEPHRAGAVKGVPKSLGFIDTEAANRGYGAGHLDDAVVDAVLTGKELEQDAARRRAEALGQPYATQEPPHFRTTAQMEHLDFTRVIDRSDPCLRASDKQWRSGGAGIRGPQGLRVAGDGATAVDALPSELVEAERELKRHNQRSARPPPSFDHLTTQRESFAPLDFNNACGSNDRWAEHPTQHRAQVDLAARATREPRVDGGRNYGSLETEYSRNMQNPGRNADFSTRFHHPSVLDLRNGTSQMKSKWHRPREAVLGDSVPELNAANVVGRQFATTNRHFFAGGQGSGVNKM